MHARGRQKAGEFWWRAAEPIPARPEKLASCDDHDEAAAVAHGASHAAANGVAHLSPNAARTSPEMFARHRETVDLGAYRPVSTGAPHVNTPVVRPMPAGFPVQVSPLPEPSSTPVEVFVRPRRGGIRRRHALLAAGLAGALLFAVVTGFGRHVRHVESLSDEADRLLVAAGFGINEVSLSGHRHTLDQDVFRALGAGHATLLTFDVDAARRRLEALPWIESASLQRIFPDKLRVEMRERRPAAVWHDGNRTALVDAEGRVLSYVASHVPPDLPRIAGSGAPAASAELRAALAQFPTVASRVHLARRIGDRRWDLELSNGATVKLAAGPIAASLQRLVRLEQETRWLDHSGQIVDLTVPRAIAVSTPAAATGIDKRAAVRHAPLRPL
ncbi:MAG: FtsQ-type POTRA domain-containing protein [Hyphomicrobiaceae bacterium]